MKTAIFIYVVVLVELFVVTGVSAGLRRKKSTSNPDSLPDYPLRQPDEQESKRFLDIFKSQSESPKMEEKLENLVPSNRKQINATLDSAPFNYELSSEPRYAVPAAPAFIVEQEKPSPINSPAVNLYANEDAGLSDVDSHQESHSRRKRAISPGAGIPTDFTFTLEALPPHNTDPASFSISTKVTFKLTIWASIEDMNVSVEIYSQTSGGAYFMISNVRFGAIGTNINRTIFDTSTKEVTYDSKFKDGRWDVSRINLGLIVNEATDITNAAASKIELLWEAQALNHTGFVVGNKYKISVGCIYSDEDYLTIAQKALTYAAFAVSPNIVDPSFTITGPSNLTVETTGVWSISASIADIYSNVALDVIAPINLQNVMVIDAITISRVGNNYKYSVAPDDMGNITRNNYTNYGAYASFDLGTILNAGYLTNNPNNNTADNTLIIDVAITLLDHQFNASSTYTIGFAFWRYNTSSIEILWSAQHYLAVNNNTLPDLVVSPTFLAYTNSPVVQVGKVFSLLLNVTIPSGSVGEYQFEVDAAVNGSLHSVSPIMDIKRLRLSRVGFNMPHLSFAEPPKPEFSSADNISTDYALWNLGVITNTAQRNKSEDNTIQIEVAIQMLDNVLLYFSNYSDVPILLGMRHGSTYYWVGWTNVTIAAGEVASSEDKKGTTVSLINKMGPENLIYSNTPAVLDFDITIPPGVDYPMIFEVNTLYQVTDSKSRLNIVSINVTHVGAALLYTLSNSTLIGISTDLEAVTNKVINSSAIMIFDRVASLRDVDYPRYYFKDSTMRVRMVVVARPDSNVALVNGTGYFVEGTIEFGTHSVTASRLMLTYISTLPNMFTGKVWQPYYGWSIMPDSSALVKPGASARFNITIAFPYRTSAETNVKGESNGNIQICSVKLLSMGSAIVRYQPPTSLGPQIVRDGASTNRTSYANHAQPMMTSFGRNWYYDKFSMDTYMTYQVVANLLPTVAVGSNVTFRVFARFGSTEVALDPLIAAFNTPTPVKSSSEELPVIAIAHLEGTNKINIGGQEIYYVDIYVPPNTHDSYYITVYAPYNSSFYGNIEIVEAHLVNVGTNLECWYRDQSTQALAFSSDNQSGRKDQANFNMGALINPQPRGTNITDENNRVRVMVLVSIHRNSTLTVGDQHSIAARVDLNGGANIFVGYSTFTVIAPSDESNVRVNATLPSLDIVGSGDRSFTIGETQSYTGTITIPAGTAFSEFKAIIETPSSSQGEALGVISNVAITANSAGKHLPVLIPSSSISYTYNSVKQCVSSTIDFGFVRNTNFTFLTKYFTTGTNNHALTITFSIRLMDDVILANNYVFNMTTRLQYGSLPNVIYATGHVAITVVTTTNDMPVIDFLPSFINLPANINQDSVLSFSMSISLAASSLRFPENISIYFRVPKYSQMNDTVTYNFINPGFTPDNEIGTTGLVFQLNKLRYFDAGIFNFSITVDPTRFLEPGLFNRYISIPVDIGYYLPDKSVPSTSTQYFTTIKVLTAKVFIAEDITALGMESDSIQDCQITSSNHDGTNLPIYARLNSGSGWGTSPRGPPLYQTEYIQVDMGGSVKFTGITLQPFNDLSATRISTFRIEYSRLGIKWENALDEHLDTKTFNVVWPGTTDANTTVFIGFDNMTFIGRYIRVIPLTNLQSTYSMKLRFELHGYPYPRGSSLPTYDCPETNDTLKDYDERQVLFMRNADLMFACMIQSPGQLPYCSGSIGGGAEWFVVDDNVLNIYGYDTNSSTLYALARDRRAVLRSTDLGQRWYVVGESEYTEASNSTTFESSKAVPFPPEGTGTAEFFANYGEQSGTNFWSVSQKAVHNYPADPATLTDAVNQVAYWGNKEWTQS